MLSHTIRNTWLIFRHEYLQRVRTRSFMLTTLLMPAFIGLIVATPALLSGAQPNPHAQRIVVVCPDVYLARAVSTQLTNAGRGRYLPEVDRNASGPERRSLEADVNAGEVDGFLWIDPAAIESGKVIYVRRGSGDFLGQILVRNALSTAFVLDRLRQRGISAQEADSMMRQVTIDAVTLSGGRRRRDSLLGGIVIVFVFVSALFITLLTYGVMVMRSVMEEKNSRVIEVLLCSATAGELMGGKILGVGAVGLTQVSIWGALAFAIGGPHASAALGGVHLEISLALYFALFYTLGYLLYSAMFAAVGASFNSTDEAQQWNFVIISPLILASTLMTPVASAPNSALAVAGSMIPFCAPVLMYLRIVVQRPPGWEIVLCIALLVATIWIVLVICARIYRVGILMYGKRPTAREVLKWLRYA